MTPGRSSFGEPQLRKCTTLQHRRDCDVAGSMTFRIETAARGRFTVFTLSGRIESHAVDELTRLFELCADRRDIVLDLKDVSLVLAHSGSAV